LHLHTTASDGRLTPRELVDRASAAGLRTISVTDHDTVAGLQEAGKAATAAGLRLVPGIEITAVNQGRDVHVLGYFIDVAHEPLAAFLEEQRAHRVSRLREIGSRLAALGAPLEVDGVLEQAAARPGSSVGRPLLARALLDAGHVHTLQEAFDRFLATGMPAFVPRTGSPPAHVVDVIHAANGIASLAHPGVTSRDEIIEPLVGAGLDAIEVYHSDHSPEQQGAYAAMARAFGLAVSGGSDYHGEIAVEGPGRPRRATLGRVSLPSDAFHELEARAHRRSRAR
ncbi:MAG: PHP domain-containing protein, partial [Vicinamibacterales bacterium]